MARIPNASSDMVRRCSQRDRRCSKHRVRISTTPVPGRLIGRATGIRSRGSGARMASTRKWFESIAEAERRAKRRLPRSVYKALVAGAENGVTLESNKLAFAEIGLIPRIASGVSQTRTLATTVVGIDIAMPVIASPVGVQAVHPDGEAAVARATAAAGTATGLSSFATQPIEEVVAANPKTFFQAYWLGERGRIRDVLQRALDARAAGLIVTLDWSFAHRRDW